MEQFLPNRYTEDFRRNVVALIKSGVRPVRISERLGISRYTIYGWTHAARYANVPPASEELIKSLSSPIQTEETKQTLVPIAETASLKSYDLEDIKLRIGKLQIECTKNSLVTVFKALGEAGVL